MTAKNKNRIVELMGKKFFDEHGAIPVGIAILLLVTSLVGLAAGYKAVQTPTQTQSKAASMTCDQLKACPAGSTKGVNCFPDANCLDTKPGPCAYGTWIYDCTKNPNYQCTDRSVLVGVPYWCDGTVYHNMNNFGECTNKCPAPTSSPNQPTQPPLPQGSNNCFYLTAQISNIGDVWVTFNPAGSPPITGDIELIRNNAGVAGPNRWYQTDGSFTFHPGSYLPYQKVTLGSSVNFTGRMDACGERGNRDDITCSLSADGNTVSGTTGRCFKYGTGTGGVGATNTPIPPRATNTPQPGQPSNTPIPSATECNPLTITVMNDTGMKLSDMSVKIPNQQWRTDNNGQVKFGGVLKTRGLSYEVIDDENYYLTNSGTLNLIDYGCDQTIRLNRSGQVQKMTFWGNNSTFLGNLIAPRTIIRAWVTSEQYVCGSTMVTQAGSYKLSCEINTTKLTIAINEPISFTIRPPSDSYDSALVARGPDPATWESGAGRNVELATSQTELQEWVNFWGLNSTLDEKPIPVGAVVEAYTIDGTRCGSYTVIEAGRYGLQCEKKPNVTWPKDSRITFLINGFIAQTKGPDDPIWTSNGDGKNVELNALSTSSVQAAPPPAAAVQQGAPGASQWANRLSSAVRAAKQIFTGASPQPEKPLPTSISGKVRVNNSTFASVEKVMVALYSDKEASSASLLQETQVNLTNKEGTFEFGNLENKEYYLVAFARTSGNKVYSSEKATAKIGQKVNLTINIGEQGLRYTLKKTQELGTTARARLSTLPVVGPFIEMFIISAF